jgi:hypothetical protein
MAGWRHRQGLRPRPHRPHRRRRHRRLHRRWLFAQLGIGFGGGLFGAILSATIGAIVLLLTIGLVRRSA